MQPPYAGGPVERNGLCRVLAGLNPSVGHCLPDVARSEDEVVIANMLHLIEGGQEG